MENSFLKDKQYSDHYNDLAEPHSTRLHCTRKRYTSTFTKKGN